MESLRDYDKTERTMDVKELWFVPFLFLIVIQ